MFLKGRSQDHRVTMTLGLLCLLIGILSSSIAEAGFPAAALRDLFGSESLVNAFQGFADGFAVPMLGISIYLNVKGLWSFRNRSH
jgi:hypothetical protein